MSVPDLSFYPKIPHLQRGLTDPELIVPHGAYYVSEKLDGANAGVKHVEPGVLAVHSRSRLLGLVGDFPSVATDGGLRGFFAFVQQRWQQLADTLPVGAHVYGEWLVSHTVSYPKGLLNRWWVFPRQDHMSPELVDIEGVAVAPEFARMVYEGQDDFLALADASVQAYLASTGGRAIEGAVLRHERGSLFKVVLPQFQEHAKKRWSGTKALAKDSTEAALAAMYSLRAYQKAVEGISDAVGRPLRMEDTPRVLEVTWGDFAQEVLPQGIRKLHWPTIDTRRLRGELQSRVKELLHTELTTGSLPQWALHGGEELAGDAA